MPNPIPEFVQTHYEIHQWKHPVAILNHDFPNEWNDLVEVLTEFRLRKSDILAPGRGKSPVATALDSRFYRRGWLEKAFDTKVVIDEIPLETPTHKVDCFKNEVAIEVEWNNKDPFFDRDLNNFRLLFEYRAISVGVIITRCNELQDIFNELDKGSSYGASTTHMSKLTSKLWGGGAGGCPVLVFGITRRLYVEE